MFQCQGNGLKCFEMRGSKNVDRRSVAPNEYYREKDQTKICLKLLQIKAGLDLPTPMRSCTQRCFKLNVSTVSMAMLGSPFVFDFTCHIQHT